MYKDSDLKVPDNDEKVWRYMDFTKFVSLLDKQALFFPTIKLLRLSDPWEGSWSNFEIHEYVSGTPESKQHSKDLLYPFMSKAAAQQIAASCWHINKHESGALWKIYVSGNEGLAIQTTFSNLKDCFDFDHETWPHWPDNFSDRKVPITAGQVEYFDPEQPSPTTKTTHVPMYKRQLFDYERELRLLAQLYPIIGVFDIKDQELDNEPERIPVENSPELSPEVREQVEESGGIYLPVKLDTLIENIYIAPNAQKWFVELVKNTLKLYALEKPVHRSNMTPPY